jgi:itaconate CoA-transferase
MSILALRSTAGRQRASSIVVNLDGRATLAADQVDHVVTEYGVASLRGADPAARAAALVCIAHPEHRDALARAAHANKE